jgi:hypothetical protein
MPPPNDPPSVAGFFMDRFTDDITLAIYGDTDAGYGLTYKQIADEAPQDEDYAAECDYKHGWRNFRYGKHGRPRD